MISMPEHFAKPMGALTCTIWLTIIVHFLLLEVILTITFPGAEKLVRAYNKDIVICMYMGYSVQALKFE